MRSTRGATAVVIVIVTYTTFEAAFTGTGRLSSRDPNLQNLPAFGHWAERIKEGLVPVGEGNVFVAADYS